MMKPNTTSTALSADILRNSPWQWTHTTHKHTHRLLPGHILYIQTNHYSQRSEETDLLFHKPLREATRYDLNGRLKLLLIFGVWTWQDIVSVYFLVKTTGETRGNSVFFSSLQCILGLAACCPKTAAKQESTIETRSLNWLLCQTSSYLSMATETHTRVTGLCWSKMYSYCKCSGRTVRLFNNTAYNVEQIHLFLMTHLHFFNLMIKETECLKWKLTQTPNAFSNAS